MGTPAGMIIELGEDDFLNGEYEVQCVNYDGYPSHMLPMLNTFYCTADEIFELFRYGDASALEPTPDKMKFYHRDSNEDWADVRPFQGTLEECIEYLGDGVDFTYLFEPDVGEWKLYESR